MLDIGETFVRLGLPYPRTQNGHVIPNDYVRYARNSPLIVAMHTAVPWTIIVPVSDVRVTNRAMEF